MSGRLSVSRSLTSVVSLKWLTRGITDMASVHIGASGPRTENATEAVIDNIDCALLGLYSVQQMVVNKGKGSPYSITERRVPDLIPVLGSPPAGDVSHKPGGRLPLLSARPAVTFPARRLLPISLLGEQMHDGCKQFA